MISPGAVTVKVPVIRWVPRPAPGGTGPWSGMPVTVTSPVCAPPSRTVPAGVTASAGSSPGRGFTAGVRRMR
ncbi:hypothetical protein DEJ50_22805 [Streptomyces venezuelae]|uniref:Uncharacterized protein n=1 Tax=Streptomyces venezuelae TaxID=54571 RepID=A0A5P2D4Y9_STRVZ|nr:hypothetical protein DEJ50_22805 [Streptomyces venezuelae]